MSRLSDCQIVARIEQCEATAAKHRSNGRFKLAFAAQTRASVYRVELAAREKGEAVQEPQEDHRR